MRETMALRPNEWPMRQQEKETETCDTARTEAMTLRLNHVVSTALLDLLHKSSDGQMGIPELCNALYKACTDAKSFIAQEHKGFRKFVSSSALKDLVEFVANEGNKVNGLDLFHFLCVPGRILLSAFNPGSYLPKCG